jgi:hypothetical protein
MADTALSRFAIFLYNDAWVLILTLEVAKQQEQCHGGGSSFAV